MGFVGFINQMLMMKWDQGPSLITGYKKCALAQGGCTWSLANEGWVCESLNIGPIYGMDMDAVSGKFWKHRIMQEPET
ncbi:unnamed protein product [Prunus armeniaca]|uniref:Uncharacterized protein n=1 Tax=Prunus armeniaca TaxID=36596 RepID=A0A6J5TLM5_PRUAR|nr:unnamed protein product [Prunus armeniaca]